MAIVGDFKSEVEIALGNKIYCNLSNLKHKKQKYNALKNDTVRESVVLPKV